MAFAAGSRMRVKLTSAALTQAQLQPQPPLIGVVTDVNGTTITADMGNGTIVTADATVLDEITPANVLVRDALLDKVVNGLVTAPSPPAAGVPYAATYTGRVVDVYNVNTVPKALIQANQNGMFYELPIGKVVPLANQ